MSEAQPSNSRTEITRARWDRRTVLALAPAIAVLGTRLSSAQSPPSLVFAAASLKDVLDAIAAKWRSEGGGKVTISYAASSTLAKQIENGAPADLFISADRDWMDYLQQRNLIDAKTRVDLLGNQLVLIVPKDSPARTTLNAHGVPIVELLGNGRLAIADPASVPAGRYAKASLTMLGLWDAVSKRIAAAENVRAALLLVARGEAPVGIVYLTDAMVEPAVRVFMVLPSDTHSPIVYPMALTMTARPPAARFATYLEGAAARSVFEAQGFAVLSADGDGGR